MQNFIAGWHHRLAADLGSLAVLGLVALGSGLLVNLLRRDPLPWRYDSPADRLQTAAAGLSPQKTASQPVRQITLAEFQQFAASRTGLILDARPDVFYREGHVPGALNLARETFAADYARLRSQLAPARDRPLVVYCSDADCPDSGLVASALQQLGFRQVAVYPAGWEGWTAAGLPEEKATLP